MEADCEEVAALYRQTTPPEGLGRRAISRIERRGFGKKKLVSTFEDMELDALDGGFTPWSTVSWGEARSVNDVAFSRASPDAG